jgi:hypothetical protein
MHWSLAASLGLMFAVEATTAQPPQTPPRTAPVAAVAIQRPRNPIPAEAATARVTRFSFIAYGDTRGRRDGTELQYEHSLIVESMLRTITSLERGPDPVRFVLQSGDAVVNGGDAKQWNVSFVDLINRLTTDGGVPYYLAPGNHDVTSAAALDAPLRQTALANYLRAVGQLIPPDGNTRRLDGYPTYAFGYGNTFVVAFDSNIADDSVQFRWVQRQLEGLDRQRYHHVVAFFHHPAFSSGPHGGPTIERQTATIRARYMPLFRKHNVDLLLTGHEHLFEHWVERYRGADGSRRRIDQIVSGGGGAPLYAYTGEPFLADYLAAGRPDSVRLEHLVRPGVQRGDNPYHYLIVHVDGDKMWFDVVGVDWGTGFQPYKSARVVLSDSVRTP